MKASIWRALMAIGMKFHHYADPKPPRPNFKIRIPSRLSPKGGTFKLVFYVPEAYVNCTDDNFRFPVVVNFHGGGFTLGTGTDDARWAACVLENVDAVLVSVEYRLAPEYPFSTGVEDCTDAILYLASHAEELKLDPHRIALSGFSAGGNFAFTVPLLLHDLRNHVGKRSLAPHPQRPSPSRNTSTTSIHRPLIISPDTPSASTTSLQKLPSLEPSALELTQSIPDLTLQCIVSFYPPTDFRESRDKKRATNPHPEKNLPPTLTDLFDKSYMQSLSSLDMTDPYLSPAAATDSFLSAAYPQNIVLYTCEYDMLNAEGVAFGERLSSPPIGKSVKGGLINSVPHAFDKKPNPLKFPKAADRCYSEACAELKKLFGERVAEEERRQLEAVKDVDRWGEGTAVEGLTEEARELIERTRIASPVVNQEHVNGNAHVVDGNKKTTSPLSQSMNANAEPETERNGYQISGLANQMKSIEGMMGERTSA